MRSSFIPNPPIKHPCRKDCPRRSKGDQPSCHNPERCSDWAEYLKAKEEFYKKNFEPAAGFRRQNARKAKAARIREELKHG